MNQKTTEQLRCILNSTLMLVIFCLLCPSCVTSSKSPPKSRTALQQSQMGSYTFALRVDGLNSQSQAKIQAAMQKFGKVESVLVNQKNKLVRITLKTNRKISDQQVMQAVKQAGYVPKEIVKGPMDLSQLEKMIPKKK